MKRLCLFSALLVYSWRCCDGQQAPTFQALEASEIPAPVISTSITKVTTIIGVAKPQNRKLWVLVLSNPSPSPIQVSRAAILVALPNITQLTRDQVNAAQSDTPWAVLSRVGQEVVVLAPAGLSAAGIATKTASLGWIGLGVSVAEWFVARATARAQAVGTELPDWVALPGNGGGEYLVHAAKGPKHAPAVQFSIAVSQ